MANRFYFDKGIRNARVARPVSGRVFNWLTIISAAGLLLSCGFVMSARKHFEAISVGYKGEEMRRQAAQLEEKLRALEMEYARESSPFEIERRAKQLGLQRPEAAQGSGVPSEAKKPAAGQQLDRKPESQDADAEPKQDN